MESAYAPRPIPSKRPTRKDTPLSHGLDPFVWDPPNPELGGGTWIPPTPPPLPGCNENGVVEITEGLIGSKSRGQSPASFQNLLFASRDKESLLEEIIQLKRMLIDQAFYLKRDKVHASAVQIENKKLENDIKDMEMQGNMGTKSRMKSQFEELQNICDSQHEEITLLRRDVRISHQREIEMEKDVFVEEIAKLQKDVKKLKLVHSQLCCENKDLCCMRDKAGDMEVLNYHLENCMEPWTRQIARL
ncbi:hypothetical protein SELMODRAFT_417148 [Selaginella moellendorffii]|uniref:Uncharacterized protein n=1 Tax=Selaginella moellendorffii TaxID=88036 RepID=D8S1I7_SELML|nr:hypothetical protein SELMODRAFT_417148 [Selaginella moellendorffii]